MASKVLMGDINVESKNFTNLIFIESLSEEEKVCRYGRSQLIKNFLERSDFDLYLRRWLQD